MLAIPSFCFVQTFYLFHTIASRAHSVYKLIGCICHDRSAPELNCFLPNVKFGCLLVPKSDHFKQITPESCSSGAFGGGGYEEPVKIR